MFGLGFIIDLENEIIKMEKIEKTEEIERGDGDLEVRGDGGDVGDKAEVIWMV